jgi:hypothetical protein
VRTSATAVYDGHQEGRATDSLSFWAHVAKYAAHSSVRVEKQVVNLVEEFLHTRQVAEFVSSLARVL